MVTSFNRLVAARPHSAAHVEAPDPDIIMRRSGDLGKDHDPSDGINAPALRIRAKDEINNPRSPRLRNHQLRRGDRYRRAV